MMRKLFLSLCVFSFTLTAEQKMELSLSEPLGGICMGSFFVTYEKEIVSDCVLYDNPRISPAEGDHEYSFERHCELTTGPAGDQVTAVVGTEEVDVLSEPGKQILWRKRAFNPSEEHADVFALREFAESHFFSPVSVLGFEHSLENREAVKSDPLDYYVRTLLNQPSNLYETDDKSVLKIEDQWVDVDLIPHTPDVYQLRSYPEGLGKFFLGEGAWLGGRVYGGASRTVKGQEYELNTNMALYIDVLDADKNVLRSIQVDWTLVCGFEDGMIFD